MLPMSKIDAACFTESKDHNNPNHRYTVRPARGTKKKCSKIRQHQSMAMQKDTLVAHTKNLGEARSHKGEQHQTAKVLTVAVFGCKALARCEDDEKSG